MQSIENIHEAKKVCETSKDGIYYAQLTLPPHSSFSNTQLQRKKHLRLWDTSFKQFMMIALIVTPLYLHHEFWFSLISVVYTCRAHGQSINSFQHIKLLLLCNCTASVLSSLLLVAGHMHCKVYNQYFSKMLPFMCVTFLIT